MFESFSDWCKGPTEADGEYDVCVHAQLWEAEQKYDFEDDPCEWVFLEPDNIQIIELGLIGKSTPLQFPVLENFSAKFLSNHRPCFTNTFKKLDRLVNESIAKFSQLSLADLEKVRAEK